MNGTQKVQILHCRPNQTIKLFALDQFVQVFSFLKIF